MSDEPGITTLDDILYDLEGTRKAEGPCADFFATAVEAIPGGSARRMMRGGSLRGAGPPVGAGAGHSLLARCAPLNRRRFETLLYFEEKLRPEDDHGYLIGPACQILESELDRLLTAPAQGIAVSLIAAMQVARKDRQQAEILEKWAAGQVPTTIGIGSLVLLALRRGHTQRLGPVLEFLAAQFGPGYEPLLASKALGQCLDLIRTRFRNPACHGTAAFDADGYGEFARLVVANQRFAAWHVAGPDPPEPPAGIGILHHHWHHMRESVTGTEQPLPASPSGRQADPTAMPPVDQPTRTSAAGLRLSVSRDVGPDGFELLATTQSPVAALASAPEEPSGLPRPISVRTGERVRIEVVVEQRGYVTVFAIGPTGNLSVLYPDDAVGATPPAPVEAHQELLIGDVELTPPDGRERLFVVWSRAPLPLAPQALQRLAEERRVAGSSPDRATRDMKRPKQSVHQSGLEEWHAVVLELDHHQ
jgi:hypothetical protein